MRARVHILGSSPSGINNHRPLPFPSTSETQSGGGGERPTAAPEVAGSLPVLARQTSRDAQGRRGRGAGNASMTDASLPLLSFNNSPLRSSGTGLLFNKASPPIRPPPHLSLLGCVFVQRPDRVRPQSLSSPLLHVLRILNLFNHPGSPHPSP